MPAEENVYEADFTILPPAAIAAVATSLMVAAPAPAAEVARWKRVADAPALAALIFDTVAENEVAVPAVADVGVMPPAVRSVSAGGEATVTAVHAPQLLFSFDSSTAAAVSAQARI